MIHIADTKVARRYGDFFIRQIHKFNSTLGLGSTAARPMIVWFESYHSPTTISNFNMSI